MPKYWLWAFEARLKLDPADRARPPQLRFAGSMRAGTRAAAVMGLIHSGKLNGRSLSLHP
jgi:hypothetical protein